MLDHAEYMGALPATTPTPPRRLQRALDAVGRPALTEVAGLNAPDLAELEKINLAGRVAPSLRRRAGAPRKITLIDKDGTPTRITTDVEVAKGVLARADIEFGVLHGTKESHRFCAKCGIPFSLARKMGGANVAYCLGCRKVLCKCGQCGAPIRQSTGWRAWVEGRIPTCAICDRPQHCARLSVGRARLAVVRDGKAESARQKAAAESHCRDCDKPLRVPTLGAAWTLRRRYPTGRRCRSCAQRTRSAQEAGARADYATAKNNPAGSDRWFRRACRKMPTIKIGRAMAILWSDAERLFESERHEPPPSAPKVLNHGKSGARPRSKQQT